MKNKGCIIAAAVGAGLLLLCIGFALLLGGGVWMLTRGAVDASDQYLGLLGQGKIQEAYDSSSTGFREATSYKVFEKYIQGTHLDRYASRTWTSRNVVNDAGTVSGSITLKDGKTFAATIHLVHENDVWRVQRMEIPNISIDLDVPSEAEAAELALERLLAFDQAVKTADFSAFREGCATGFQSEFSPEKLLTTFKPFVDAKADISGIKDLAPVFQSAPGRNAAGALSLEGQYPTAPMVVKFDLQFGPDGGEWKCIAINVSLAPK